LVPVKTHGTVPDAAYPDVKFHVTIQLPRMSYLVFSTTRKRTAATATTPAPMSTMGRMLLDLAGEPPWPGTST